MMKVLHVIPGIAPRYGGPSQAIIDLCQELQTRGVDVLVATTDADGENRLQVCTGVQTLYNGVRTIFFPRQFSEAYKYSGDLSSWLRKNVHRFDVVHVHAVFSHSSLAAANECQRRNVPYIVRPTGSLNPWGLKRKRLAKAILWRGGIKRMLTSAAAIHYTTLEEKRLAEKELSIRSGVVVPLGVRMYVPGTSEEKVTGTLRLCGSPYVLILSRIHPIKNIEALLQAFLAVTASAEYQHWKLVIVGDGEGEYVSRLKQIAKDVSRDSVIFTGWLDGARKAEVLRGANLFVLPSFQESFGLAIVEAMLYGIPVVVSSNVNLAQEIAAAGAGWVVDLGRESLEKTLADALGNDLERKTRGAAGEKLARSRYTWPAVATALCDLYEEVRTTART